jgi:branched-chain amino acid transport system permease protein
MDTFFQLLLNGLSAGSLYALVAIGFNLIYGTTKFFNLTHGSMLTVGAYAVVFLADERGVSLGLAIAAGVALAGAAGFAIEKTVYLPLRRRRASNMVLLVASLGALTAIQAAIAMLFTSEFRALANAGAPSRTTVILGGAVTTTQIIIFFTALASAVGVWLLLRLTLLGKAITAVSDDEEVAAVVGIDTNRVIATVFVIGSGLAGLAGILLGLDNGVDPAMGLNLLLKGVIACIVGGIGSLPGAVLGAFVLGLIENFGIWKISGVWKDAIAFGVLIVFLLVRPRGLISRS